MVLQEMVMLLKLIIFIILVVFVVSPIFSSIFYIIFATIKNLKCPVKVVKHIRTVFHDAKLMCKKEGIDLHFIFSPIDFIFRGLNGNSSLPKVIMVSASWIPKLSSDDLRWRLAFFHTVGHEVGHKMNEPKGSRQTTAKAIFTNWVRECRADFYGVTFIKKHFPTAQMYEILEAIELKINHNAPQKEQRLKNDNLHPDWEFRYKLLEEFPEFNDAVVKHIAIHAKFKDENYISQMIDVAIL